VAALDESSLAGTSRAPGGPFEVGPLFSAEQVRAIHLALDSSDVEVAFQPIVDLRRRTVHAYEALARPTGEVFRSPMELIDVAVQAGRIAELGRLHRKQATARCPRHPLFLNIDANEFDYGWLVRPDDPIFTHRSQVTLEITEAVPIKYFSQCHSVLAEIRRRGVQLAIDDFGAGFSNVKYILELEPEIVKLDRELIAEIAPRTRQAALCAALTELCHAMGARVVAEGVETLAELRTLMELGVDLAQGFLIGRPASWPFDVRWPADLH
jgi:EAL domain-containing protein (putative c-di-GMP-specific phosphodiesterase class I)